MWMEKLLPINVTGGDSGSLSVCWLSEALVCGNACVFSEMKSRVECEVWAEA